MKSTDKIYVAGHSGLVGSAIVRQLKGRGFKNILTAAHKALELTNQAATDEFFEHEQPDFVILAAAKVGGIVANEIAPAEFIGTNLAIQNNVVHAAWKNGCRRLLFLGTGCIYPREANNPIHESELLTGPLEATNQWYAIAKIAGIKMCEAYRKQYGFSTVSAMPCNLYGPNDYFDLETAHVLPALLRRFHEARLTRKAHVDVWGTGRPRREFLHVDDAANACVVLLARKDIFGLINVGFGQDIPVAGLATLIAEVTGYTGEIRFDTKRPDGTPQKLLDSNRLRSLGWQPEIGLRDGVRQTYEWYLENLSRAKGVA